MLRLADGEDSKNRPKDRSRPIVIVSTMVASSAAPNSHDAMAAGLGAPGAVDIEGAAGSSSTSGKPVGFAPRIEAQSSQRGGHGQQHAVPFLADRREEKFIQLRPVRENAA
jgi:hypothetical protein